MVVSIARLIRGKVTIFMGGLSKNNSVSDVVVSTSVASSGDGSGSGTVTSSGDGPSSGTYMSS